MPRKPKAKPADLPAIPAELLKQFGSGPMAAEAINAATLTLKKALIERALGDGEIAPVVQFVGKPLTSYASTSATIMSHSANCRKALARRYAGQGHERLRRRVAVYKAARAHNPGRWNGKARA